MGKGTFRALVTTCLVLPVMIVIAVLTHADVRGRIVSFFKPLPPAPSRNAGPAPLPSAQGARGAESAELKTLREDASAEHDATPLAVRPRAALFALGADGQIPTSGDRFVRPTGLRRPEIMGRDDESIDRAVHHLTADAGARERFVEALRKSGRFAPEIHRLLRAWKLPELLLAVSFVESAFQPTAVSNSDNAMGLWQLTPDVAHVYGLSMLPSYDERRGISTGTEAFARYLADLRERFGSWELALAAYAIGYKRTSDAATTFGSTDFWELAPSLPRGARVYVAEVLGAAVLLANLDRFGLDTVRRVDPTNVSDLEVSAGTSLRHVARAARVAPSTLLELNPEYAAEIVPSAAFRMVVHVPSDTLSRARELLPFVQDGKDVGTSSPDRTAADAEAGPDAGAGVGPLTPPVISRGTSKRMFYRVREGDTLASLARENGISVETLASDNALDSTSSLKPGMILTVRLPATSPSTGSSSSRKNLPPPKGPKKPGR